MTTISNSILDLSNSIKKRKAARAATSKATRADALPLDALERAIVILEEDAAFSDNETMEVIDMFMADQELAKVYVTLQASHKRSTLVVHHLAKRRGGSA